MLPVAELNGSMIPTVVGPVNRLSSLFDRFFNDEPFTPLFASASNPMPMSMWEDEQNVYLEIDTPGIAEKDIDIAVHQTELIIKGERKCERKGEGYDNRSYGRFEKSISLPTRVDANKTTAKMNNGVLTITLPKCEEVKPRKIAIKPA